MDIITYFPPPQFVVVAGKSSVSMRLLDTAAAFAVKRPLLLIDGGNRARPYYLAGQIRRRTPRLIEALQRIEIRRAFTCYQMTNLLEKPQHESQSSRPLFVLDLLATYYDESVSLREARRLLEQSIAFLRAISQSVLVVVSAQAPVERFPERQSFYTRLCDCAGTLWEEESPAPLKETMIQARLF